MPSRGTTEQRGEGVWGVRYACTRVGKATDWTCNFRPLLSKWRLNASGKGVLDLSAGNHSLLSHEVSGSSGSKLILEWNDRGCVGVGRVKGVSYTCLLLNPCFSACGS